MVKAETREKKHYLALLQNTTNTQILHKSSTNPNNNGIKLLEMTENASFPFFIGPSPESKCIYVIMFYLCPFENQHDMI